MHLLSAELLAHDDDNGHLVDVSLEDPDVVLANLDVIDLDEEVAVYLLVDALVAVLGLDAH